MPTLDRQFSVHARHIDRHHARVISEQSFEAAAVAYCDDFGDGLGDAAEINVVVRDLDSGHEHCFRIDLETGQAGPCA
jgi:hypothetical protein